MAMTNQHFSDRPRNSTFSFDTDRIAAQIRKWKERLLDLTRANPLLGINRSRVSKLRVTEPDVYSLFDKFIVNEEVLRMPLVRKKLELRPASLIATQEHVEEDYFIEQGDLSFEAKPIDLQRRLRRIYDNARTTVEERGVTTLHLTFGVLEWDDPALEKSSSPLWMIPCQFEYCGPNAALRLQRADDEIKLNPALELYLRERQRVSLPSIPEEPSSGDFISYLAGIRELVREQGWNVSQEVWLSTFSFESLAIYQDLIALADVAAMNPIVAAFARAGASSVGSEALGENLDDLPTPDRVPIPVLPADASQLRAIALGAAGQNLVVHGPPGTGKSQTISNLISDALGRRQKVLFVSAKMAALDVVHNRLAEKGLARFCLEAHSTKAGKAKIIEELKNTLERTCDNAGELLEEQLEELIRVRSNLNEYVHKLHERREPLGLSVFAAIGKIAKLYDAPVLAIHELPWEDPLMVSRAELRATLDLLNDLASQSAIFDQRHSHPWRGLAVHSERGVREDTVEIALKKSHEYARRLYHALQALAVILGPNVTGLSIQNINDIAPALINMAACERVPQGWFSHSSEELRSAAEFLNKAAAEAKCFAERKVQYEEIITVPVAHCLQLLSPLNYEFCSWTRVMRPKYWRWRASIRKIVAANSSTSFTSLRSYLNLATKLAEGEGWFQSKDAALHSLVNFSSRDFEVFEKAAAEYYAASLLKDAIVKHNLIGTDQITLSAEIRTAAKSLPAIEGDAEFLRALQDLDIFWPGGFVEDVRVLDTPLPSLIARCEEVLAAFSQLHEWVLLQHTTQRCIAAGLGKFLNALGGTSARKAPIAFKRRFLSFWVNRAIEQSPPLGLFSSERRAERVERFRELDIRISESALGHIKAVAAEPAKSISCAQTNLGNLGEVGMLRRELQKRKRIKPLRKLFAEIPHVLQALKPCMLMSPLSVSTFLKPGSIFFDLVVFDEASQLPTQEAIPAILRGKQIIVAGDEKQLPPTSFFDASVIFDEAGGENDAEEELEPLESLLDDCVAINPVFLPAFLKWHYRSRDERLIGFSNHYFYNNSLITFPSSTTSSDGRGIYNVYVPDGIWDRGRSRTNRREAHKVAEVVIEQLSRYPDRSLGVVAMNTTQREAIEIMLSELLEQRPNLVPLFGSNRPEPFFIKALENVQGDERDTMIISTGYAKTESGALSLNFGPLNREGGWRRLNVLVTRAKWQTILITSLRSQDLAAVNPNNKGALMLRKFIEYSEAGGVLPPDSARLSRAETNDFEDAVAEALRQCDLEVDEQVGVSDYRIDLAIRDPRDKTRYLLGVECDGASYHSARTARDRDLLRQQILRNLGWRLHRIWSTEWFRNREKVIRGVLRSVEIALQADPDESPEAPMPSSSTQNSNTNRPPNSENRNKEAGNNPVNRKYEHGQPYQKYRLVIKLDSKELMDRQRIDGLSLRIAKIVMQEEPIHEDILLDRLKEIYGISRSGARIQENVKQALAIVGRRPNFRHDKIKRILYASSYPAKRFRIPGDGVNRSIEQIAQEEIELAILFIVEDQFGFPRESLPRAVTDLFQIGRTSAGVAEVVGDIVDGLIERKRLRLEGPNVYLA